VSLMETVRMYGQMLDLVEVIEWLVAEYRNESQRMINKGWYFCLLLFRVLTVLGSIGLNIRWDYFVNQNDTSRYVPASDRQLAYNFR
jgi:dynein heavy chain 1